MGDRRRYWHRYPATDHRARNVRFYRSLGVAAAYMAGAALQIFVSSETNGTDKSGRTENALLLVDSAPIIYVLEEHTEFAPIFRPVFEARENGLVRLAVTCVTLAEVLTGPPRTGDEVLVERYRFTLKSWFVVDLD